LEIFVPIALIILGIGLIVVEVYLIPGFNVVGVLGVLLIFFAVGFTFSEHGVLSGMVTMVGSFAVLGVTFYSLWRSGAWDRFVLSTSLRPGSGMIARESEQRHSYLGKEGLAVSPLRPTGIADIDGERVEVVTEGEFIAAGSHIKVVAMDRRRYFVRLSDTTETQAQA